MGPGVVATVTLLLARFGLKAPIPGFRLFARDDVGTRRGVVCRIVVGPFQPGALVRALVAFPRQMPR